MKRQLILHKLKADHNFRKILIYLRAQRKEEHDAIGN